MFISVIKNIAHLCSRNRSKMWGPNGWQKVVVCVVSDGRSKINKRTLQVLTLVCTVPQLVIAFHADRDVDGLLPGRCRKGHRWWQGRHSPHLRVSA